ncbi:hypothetical protein KJK32_47065 (plasmid) [Streptomyces sp. JCM17656]|nr:hypothetical protein KJK32_47065 [Streptomyces sp. JCM17656]
MTTDRVRAMGRTYDLEDATEYVDPTRIMEPFDWPEWGDRHNLVAQLMAGDDEDADFDDAGLGQISLMPTMDLGPRKPANASDKILKVLADLADPAGIDINYVHRDNIQSLAKLELATLENTLSKLIKAGKIHRQVEDGKEVRGMYGPGPAPTAEAVGE